MLFQFYYFCCMNVFFLLSPSSLLSLLCANGEIEENCLIAETKNRIFTCKMNKLISFTFKMRLFIFSSIVYEYGALWSYDQRKRILDFTLNKGNHSGLCNAFLFWFDEMFIAYLNQIQNCRHGAWKKNLFPGFENEFSDLSQLETNSWSMSEVVVYQIFSQNLFFNFPQNLSSNRRISAKYPGLLTWVYYPFGSLST